MLCNQTTVCIINQTDYCMIQYMHCDPDHCCIFNTLTTILIMWCNNCNGNHKYGRLGRKTMTYRWPRGDISILEASWFSWQTRQIVLDATTKQAYGRDMMTITTMNMIASNYHENHSCVEDDHYHGHQPSTKVSIVLHNTFLDWLMIVVINHFCSQQWWIKRIFSMTIIPIQMTNHSISHRRKRFNQTSVQRKKVNFVGGVKYTNFYSPCWVVQESPSKPIHCSAGSKSKRQGGA